MCEIGAAMGEQDLLKTASDDRRMFARVSARFPTKFKDSRNEFGTDVFLRNISAGGARLLAKDRMFLNDSLSLEVELPDGRDPLTLHGQVIWSHPHEGAMWEIGLEFHKVDFLKLHRLFQFNL